MKCINKYIRVVLCLVLMMTMLTGCTKESNAVSEYENKKYNTSVETGEFYAADLAVTNEDVGIDGYSGDSSLHAAGLFDVKNAKVVYAQTLFDQIYPASTTKILTAYVTLKYGKLDDVVTVSANAVNNFPSDSQMCGLKEGDQLTLEALLNGALLYSGNDTTIAIAEHVGGSVEKFVEMMNEEAKNLGATKTHFTSPHGLHDSDHYTTAYDLYLIFNACIQDQRFVDIISKTKYQADIKGSDGTARTEEWEPTNYYALGDATPPSNVTVVGGKTGTTNPAGACVILLETDASGNQYISVVMGASTKDILYKDTTQLVEALPGS